MQDSVDVCYERLWRAATTGATPQHCLRLWSIFIRTRDDFRCQLCEGKHRLAAHHIIRRSFIPMMALETGNGITLCRECHRQPHAVFNRRPDLLLPADMQGGDNDEWIGAYFGLLSNATKQTAANEHYYFLSDSALRTLKNFRCISHDLTFPGTRIEQADLIWQQTPRPVLAHLLRALGFSVPDNLIQHDGMTVLYHDEQANGRCT